MKFARFLGRLGLLFGFSTKFRHYYKLSMHLEYARKTFDNLGVVQFSAYPETGKYPILTVLPPKRVNQGGWWPAMYMKSSFRAIIW